MSLFDSDGDVMCHCLTVMVMPVMPSPCVTVYKVFDHAYDNVKFSNN